MKECELCDVPARMYCESDQASLCFDCDAKVHGANFLVARHSRSLLCQACQSPTPWKAAGPRLAPTVSLCERCVSRCDRRRSQQQRRAEGERMGEGEGGNETDEDDEDDDDDDGDDGTDGDGYGGDGDDDDEDGENQVVPWSSTPPPVPSSSSSDESSSRPRGSTTDMAAMGVSLKRMRENADLGSQDDLLCSYSRQRCDTEAASAAARSSAEDEGTSVGPFGSRRGAVLFESTQSAVESRSSPIGSPERFHEEERINGDDLLDLPKLEEYTAAVDFV
ncbi:hypothetical protein ACLOJK_020643, partial [Asimina triloba]